VGGLSIVLFAVVFFHGIARAADVELFMSSGTPMTVGAETSLADPLYSWVLTMNGQILETQAGRFFHSIVPHPGVATLALTIRSATGGEEIHSITVQSTQPVDIEPTHSSVVRAVLRTVPPAGGMDHRVILSEEGGVLVLHLDESTGGIREYHIDTNVGVDSDDDGVAANDADNRTHPSFFAGGSFPVSLVPGAGEKEREMRLVVFGVQGEVSDAKITVVFDSLAPIIPILHTMPLQDSFRKAVVLPAGGGMLQFDASDSVGATSRYLLDLDLDLDLDTDRDGNAANDNDVAGTVFERTGEETNILLLPNGKNARRVGLTVINNRGQSNTMMLSVLFGDGVMPPLPPPQDDGTLRMIASTRVLIVGEEFSLTVEGAPTGTASYAWDLQSDGQPDTTTLTPTLLLRPDAPGVLPVRATLRDANDLTLGTVQAEFTVQSNASEPHEQIPVGGEAGSEALRIDTTIEGNAVTVQPIIAESIDQTKIYSTWDFGDGAKSYLFTPTHEYADAGSYDVRLSLTDVATGREIAAAATSVTIRTGEIPSESPSEGGAFSGIVHALGFMLKVALFVFLLLLLISAVALGFFFVAAKNEGITLKEKLQAYIATMRGEEVTTTPRRVPDIIEAASVPTKVSDEPAPMKLVAEDITPPVKKKQGSPPSPVPSKPTPPPLIVTPPKPAPPPPSPKAPTPQPQDKTAPQKQTESGQLPPWLQTAPTSPSIQPQMTPSSKVPTPKPTQQIPVPPPAPSTITTTTTTTTTTPPPLPLIPLIPPVLTPPPPTPSPTPSAPVPSWLQQGMEKAKEVKKEEEKPQSVLPPPIVEETLALPTPPLVPAELEMPDDEPLAMLRAELPEEEDEPPTAPTSI